MASTGDDNKVVLRINQSVSKTNEDRSLLSTLKSRWSGNIVDSDSI